MEESEMISPAAPAPLPIVPEMVQNSREVKETSKPEESKAAAPAAEAVPLQQTPKPAHPDEVGKMVNVEA